MQTHDNYDARPNIPEKDAKKWLASLKERAAEMESSGQSTIAAGEPGDAAIAEWQYGTVTVRHMPEDQRGVLRISIGGGPTPVNVDYCTFRGDREACISLLSKALNAMMKGPG